MFKLTTKKSKRIKPDQVDKVLQVMNIMGDLTKGGVNQLKSKGYWTAEDGTHYTLRRLGGKPRNKKKGEDGLDNNNPEDDQVGGLREGAGGSEVLRSKDVVPPPLQTEGQPKD